MRLCAEASARAHAAARPLPAELSPSTDVYAAWPEGPGHSVMLSAPTFWVEPEQLTSATSRSFWGGHSTAITGLMML